MSRRLKAACFATATQKNETEWRRRSKATLLGGGLRQSPRTIRSKSPGKEPMTAALKRQGLSLVFAGSIVASGVQAQVIDNPAPNFRVPAFTLAAKPILMIDGNVAGDSMNELFNVSGAVLSPSGSLIVVNNWGESVREFDRKGQFIRIVSRKGAGPGEYRSISDLHVLDGDTLVFFDRSQRRLSVLGPDRRHVRTITGLRVAVCCSMSGGFADHESGPMAAGGNSWAAGSFRYAFGNIRSPAPAEQSFAFTPDSSALVSLPGYQASFTVVMRDTKPIPTWITYGMPFTIQPVVRFGVDELVIATGERFEYQVFDLRGKLLRTVRAAAPARPVTPAMIAERRASMGKPDPSSPGAAERMVAAFDTLKFPRTLPAYDRMFLEEDGTVWLRDYLAADSLPHGWARFDRQGKLLGTMVLPRNLSPLRFSRGHAIVALRDTTLDFQRVMVYPIVRKIE